MGSQGPGETVQGPATGSWNRRARTKPFFSRSLPLRFWGSHLTFLLRYHTCTNADVNLSATCSHKETFRSGRGCQTLRRALPGMKAPWFCSPQRSSSLPTQRARTLPAEPPTQRTSARCLGSELPGGENISRRTETLISPRPGGGDAKRAVRLSLSLASFSFHSARCFRLLGLLVLSDLPNITRAFTGLKHFQVFTTTSPPQGDLRTALLAVLSLAGSLEFLNLCA